MSDFGLGDKFTNDDVLIKALRWHGLDDWPSPEEIRELLKRLPNKDAYSTILEYEKNNK